MNSTLATVKVYGTMDAEYTIELPESYASMSYDTILNEGIWRDIAYLVQNKVPLPDDEYMVIRIWNVAKYDMVAVASWDEDQKEWIRNLTDYR